ncbi:pRL2-11 [Kitasatospora aureofaciens]|uniref:pRL2-11 n=1 Tax=Kitasatospora aureofaciens TaxID=1894 RepID=UPI0033B6E700
MDGIARTDAGAFRRGTRPANGARMTAWNSLSRAERAALRLSLSTGAGAVLWGSQTHPEATEQTLTAVGAGAALASGYGAARWVGGWRHRREWVRPLHVALEGPLGLPEGTRPESYIHIPRDYPSRTDVGRIDLPAEFTGQAGTTTSTISEIIRTKLALSDVSVSYKLAGRKPHLVLTQTPRPRSKVLYSAEDVRALVAAAPESAPLIGLGPQERVVSVDLDSESPHVLVSASTGGGKSVITRTMTAQMLNRGAFLAVLDFKRHSHKWCKGLPNTLYARDISDIHDALVALGAEGLRRNVLVDDWEGDEKDCPVGSRIAIILEEANATITKLKRYWAAVRDSKEDPKESPAIDALREILFMGRAVKIHVLLVAQSATANALGGPEVRECFSTRILARYTRNAWNMLVPEVQPVPRSSRHVGRAQVVLGGSATETQVAFLTNNEARELAMSGTVAPPLNIWGPRHQGVSGDVTPDVTPDVTVTRHAGGHAGRDQEGSASTSRTRPALTLVKDAPAAAPTVDVPPQPATPPTVGVEKAPVEPEIPRYTLAAAAREGIVPMTDSALRQAKKRDSEFPQSTDGKFTADELQRWFRNRENARTGTE